MIIFHLLQLFKKREYELNELRAWYDRKERIT